MKNKLPSIYFLHIPKTAGSSLSGIIRGAYPQKLAMPAYEIPELLKLNREEINKFQCFTGHFGTGLFSLLDRNIPCVTMLRDPFERTVSLIHYSRKIVSSSDIPNLSNEIKQIIIKGDLQEIVYHQSLSKIVENIQTLYLGYDVNLNNSSDSPNSILDWNSKTAICLEVLFIQLLHELDMNKIVDNAKKRLDTMEVVGIVEQFNDSAELICKFLGVSVPKKFHQENVSPEKLSLGGLTYRKSGEIPENVIKRIDELTACDQEIYEYGKTLFARQLRNKKRKFFWLFN
jgi:hypothetical protein